MGFKKGQSGNPRGGTKGKGSRKGGVILAAEKAAPECIRQLEKMSTGTAVPWKVRYDATIALLALGGYPLPRPPAQLQHSGAPISNGSPDGPTVVILPSNGYEVQLGPDGKPLLSVDEDFDAEPPLLPPQGPRGAVRLAPRPEALENHCAVMTMGEAEPSIEELIKIVEAAGYEVSKE